MEISINTLSEPKKSKIKAIEEKCIEMELGALKRQNHFLIFWCLIILGGWCTMVVSPIVQRDYERIISGIIPVIVFSILLFLFNKFLNGKFKKRVDYFEANGLSMIAGVLEKENTLYYGDYEKGDYGKAYYGDIDGFYIKFQDIEINRMKDFREIKSFKKYVKSIPNNSYRYFLVDLNDHCMRFDVTDIMNEIK